MRNIISTLLITTLAILPGCKEEVVYGCQVEDPVRDLDWLKARTWQLASDARTADWSYVVQARAGKKTVFYIGICCGTCSWGIQLYDCAGNAIPYEPISHETIIWKSCAWVDLGPV